MIDILCICGSKKPSPKYPNVKSACRELLRITEASIKKHDLITNFVDIREFQLPWFEGLKLEDYPNTDSAAFVDLLRKSRTILFSLPAYWGGLSGAAKNIFDLIGGPEYDTQTSTILLKDKLVAAMIIGAANQDAEQAHEQFKIILEKMGANLAKEALIINNPKLMKPETTARLAWEYGEYIARLYRRGD